MASNVRSVTVRLEAMVARYIRDVNRAGDATEKAFDRVWTSTSRARESMVETQRATDRLATSTKGLSASTRIASPSQRKLATDVDRVSVAAVRGTASIDRYSGRLRILGELLATLGPGLLPFGAVGATGLAGLVGLFGGATIGALALVGAVQGVGDALEAVEKARLDPTVENLEAAERAMSRITPQAREFVTRFQELRPVLREIRDAGAAQFFPGLTASLDSLERLAPTLERLMAAAGRAGGTTIARGADSLTSDRWEPFLDFLVEEIPDAIDNTSRLIGSLAHAGAELWMAFDPSNDRFVAWLLDVADGLDQWASSDEGREDIRGFLEFAEKTAPKVADLVVAVADALKEMAQAAAPLSGPVLDSLTAVAQAVAAIADSDLGTPILAGVAALTLYNRALQVTAGLQSRIGLSAAGGAAGGGLALFGGGPGARGGGLRQAGSDLRSYAALRTQVLARTEAETARMNASLASARTNLAGVASSAAPAGIALGTLALSAADTNDQILGTNASMGAFIGLLGGPLGAGIGLAVGNLLDLRAGLKEIDDLIASGNQRGADAALQSRLSAGSNPLGLLTGRPQTLAAQDIFTKLTQGESATSQLSKTAGSFKSLPSFKDLGIETFAQANKYLADNEAAARRAQGATLGLTAATSDLAAAHNISNDEIARAIQLTDQRTAAALGAFSAETQWRDALAAATEQAKENNAGIRGNSEEALNNRTALESLAGAWQNQRDAMEDAGRSADSIEKKYQVARRAFIDTATSMGVPIDRARQLARNLLAIPESVTADVKVNTAKAEAELRYLTRSRNMYINVISRRAPGDVSTGGGRDTRGGSTARASGGAVFGPGTETSDSIAAWLSHNEHVWSAREVRAAGGHDAVERLRAAARAGLLPRFADGGSVTPSALTGGYRRAPMLNSGGTVRTAAMTRAVPGSSGDVVAALRAELAGVRAELRAVRSAVDRGTAVNAGEHASDRASQRSGASVAAMSKSRGYLSR